MKKNNSSKNNEIEVHFEVNEKNLKLVQDLYNYHYTLDVMPPRGDGAKMAVAQEVHQLALKVYRELLNNDSRAKELSLMMLELVETMLLEKIDKNLSVEEMFALEGDDIDED